MNTTVSQEMAASSVESSPNSGIEIPVLSRSGEAGCPETYSFNSGLKEQALVRKLVQPGATVLDVGANVGKYTRLFSLLTGNTGKVFAFEPARCRQAKPSRKSWQIISLG